MNIEIAPATLGQVVQGRGGRLVFVEDDVCNIAQNLRDIDPSLRLAYNTKGEYFVVYQVLEDGSEHLVTTAQELDGRLVQRVARVCSPSYDTGSELDLLHDQATQAQDERFSQQVGEIGERLAHAVRQDLNIKKNF
jgi:hypothetical protein